MTFEAPDSAVIILLVDTYLGVYLEVYVASRDLPKAGSYNSNTSR